MKKLQKIRKRMQRDNRRMWRSRRLYRRLVRSWIEEPGVEDPDERDRRINLCCARMMESGLLAEKPPTLKSNRARFKWARSGMLSQWCKDDKKAEGSGCTTYWHRWTLKHGWSSYYWETERPVKARKQA